jgi:hypothetical protein
MLLYQTMYSTIARQAVDRAGHAWVSIRPPLSEEETSPPLLSQHPPLRPTGKVTWQSPARAAEVYCPAAAVGMEDHPGFVVKGGDPTLIRLVRTRAGVIDLGYGSPEVSSTLPGRAGRVAAEADAAESASGGWIATRPCVSEG